MNKSENFRDSKLLNAINDVFNQGRCSIKIFEYERVDDRLPLMTYGLKLSLEA